MTMKSCYFLLAIITVVNAELFTSIEYLVKAIKESEGVAKSLEDYIQLEEERLNQLKSFSKNLQVRQHELLKNLDDVTGNPMNVYKFVRLYGYDWDINIERYQQTSHHKRFQSIINKKKKCLPSKVDVHGVVDGIVRLQGTYKLSANQIANGSIHGYNTGKLSAKECYDIGHQMFINGYMARSIEWLDASVKKLKQDFMWDTLEQDRPVSSDMCTEDAGCNQFPQMSWIEKGKAMAKQQLEQQRQNFTQDLEAHTISLISHSEYAETLKQKMLEDFKNGKIEFFGKEVTRNVPSRQLYEALCRGDKLPPEEFGTYVPAHELFCTYTDNQRHPLLILQPAKVEMLFADPLIFVYHDIITDKQMEILKRDTFRNLQRAKGLPLAPKHDDDGYDIDQRISRSHYLADNHPTVDELYNYVEAATNLKTRHPAAEVLQIGNYGIGGQYEPHYDYLDEEQIKVLTPYGSDRLATILFYLSDVQVGGATVFPNIGVRIPPKKGSAAFWLNLDMDLNGKTDTIHAGCPVLLGSKWIANKWIHTHNQDLQCHMS